MANKNQPVVVIPADAASTWGAIAQSLIMIPVATVPGGPEAVRAIRALAGSVDVQAAMLQQIGSDVELIRTKPFHAAREHLDTAMRKAQAGTEYQHHLRAADDLLIEALTQCKSVEERSVVKFNLGVIAAIRGDRAEASFRLKEAYADAAAVTRELGERSANVHVVRGPAAVRGIAIAAMSLYYPVGLIVAARKYAKVKKSKQATAALRSYVPFASAVTQAHNLMDSALALPAPQLTGSGDRYELKWSEPLR